MTGPLLLCNSIGINFGYPEPDYFRTETYLSLRGHRIISDDIRIRIYMELKNLHLERGHLTGPSDIPSMKLQQRISQEVINGAIEDYLDLALCSMVREYATDYTPPAIPVDTRALKLTVAIIEKEIDSLVEKTAPFKPRMACFFIMPRKVRETLKTHNLWIDSEFLYPFLIFQRLSAVTHCQLVIAVRTNEKSLINQYAPLKHYLPPVTFIHHDIHRNLEHLYLVQAKSDAPPVNLPGTVVFDGEEFHLNEPSYDREPDYTIPDYSMADRRYMSRTSHTPMLLVDGSFGCPMKCSFCNVSYQFGPYRQRAADDIARELIHYQDSLPGVFIIMNDRIFNADMKRLHAFCDYLNDHHYGGAWCAYMVLRKEMTPALLQKVRRAGCRNISYGLESASPAILKRMRKEYSPGLASRILQDTCDAGIPIQLSLMTDFPGEEEKDFQLSIQFIEKHFHLVESFRLNQFEIYRGSDVDVHPELYGFDHRKLFSEFRESTRLRRLREFIVELENRKAPIALQE